VTSSLQHGGGRYLPYAFTEQASRCSRRSCAVIAPGILRYFGVALHQGRLRLSPLRRSLVRTNPIAAYSAPSSPSCGSPTTE
jgi:hypothetical protein